MGKFNKTQMTVGSGALLLAMSLIALITPQMVHAQADDLMPPQASSTGNADVDQMRNERQQFVKEIRRVENLNSKYTQEIEQIRSLLSEKDEDFKQRMSELENKLASQQSQKAKEDVQVEQVALTARELEDKTNEVLSKGGDLDPEDQQFREELAKAHYNMGNLYFERAEYQRAIVEYYQSVDLSPNDPDTHYNLAFISGEYLGDQETALKHYQWYMYLKPNAEDAALVKEKMTMAKLHLRSKIDSPLDKNNGHFNLVR